MVDAKNIYRTKIKLACASTIIFNLNWKLLSAIYRAPPPLFNRVPINFGFRDRNLRVTNHKNFPKKGATICAKETPPFVFPDFNSPPPIVTKNHVMCINGEGA